eukprot:CAMPEP_0168599266 /NCGR_PEP_ID=MMETSP0420-20121227/11959_1 /TAXON_ID=498008 /ORGANISM="Pessonella sp." /LENGTH=48 /DNA_ID= /DNA_START= /DNA_END= /DNA_ORIENTATION=
MLSTLSVNAKHHRSRNDVDHDDDVDEYEMKGTPNFMAPEVITKSLFQP